MTGPAFEVEDGELFVVIPDDGRVQRSPLPKGIDPAVFRNILAATDILYGQQGVMPTVEEVYKLWPKHQRRTISKIFATSEFKQALALRGIEMEEGHGLTQEQMMAITLLSDPTDTRMTTTKLRQLGISQQRYHNWMRQPLFSQLLRERSEHNLGDAIPVALNRLVGNAEKGDQRAIEKLLEVSGRYNPAQIEVTNARQVVLVMVEAVLRHVKDPDARAAILGEVQDSMQTMAITQGLKKES